MQVTRINVKGETPFGGQKERGLITSVPLESDCKAKLANESKHSLFAHSPKGTDAQYKLASKGT